jgi:IS30 family transposase
MAQRLTKTQKLEIRTLWKAGWSRSTIAKQYSVSIPTIVYHTRRIPQYSAQHLLSLLNRVA